MVINIVMKNTIISEMVDMIPVHGGIKDSTWDRSFSDARASSYVRNEEVTFNVFSPVALYYSNILYTVYDRVKGG